MIYKYFSNYLQELGKQLYMNENPNPQPYVQKIARPPDGAASRIHQPKFPILSHEFVQKIIDDEQTKSSLKSRCVLPELCYFVQSCF